MANHENNNSFLGHVYLSELQRAVRDHNLGAALLAREWNERERTSPSKAHLMYHRANDVSLFLRKSTEGFLGIGDKYKDVIRPYAEKQPPDSWLNRALASVAAKGFRFSNEMLYPQVGLNFILFTDLLMGRAKSKDVKSNPKTAVDKLERSTHNPELIPILRAAADSQVFAGALNGGKGFDESINRTEHASTETSRKAMRIGLNHKVFVTAMDVQKGKYRHGLAPELGQSPSYHEFIDHYASDATSSQMIKDHFSGANSIQEDDPSACCKDCTVETIVLQLEAARTFAIQTALKDELARVSERGIEGATVPIQQLWKTNALRLSQIAPLTDEQDL